MLYYKFAFRLKEFERCGILERHIMNPELVSDVIYKYKMSLVDAAVNNYTVMVDEP